MVDGNTTLPTCQSCRKGLITPEKCSDPRSNDRQSGQLSKISPNGLLICSVTVYWPSASWDTSIVRTKVVAPAASPAGDCLIKDPTGAKPIGEPTLSRTSAEISTLMVRAACAVTRILSDRFPVATFAATSMTEAAMMCGLSEARDVRENALLLTCWST